MHVVPRIIPQHGLHPFVVRGTVLEIVPTKTTVRLWFLKETQPPEVRIKIDDHPYQQVVSAGHPHPAKEFRIGWDREDPMPKNGERVWVTFAYSHETEQYFMGVPSLTLEGVEVIKNEADTRPGEYAEPQLNLPLATA